MYPTESLLDAKMAPLQGPALVVYNNATFTEADFRSLARIGQGSKLEKLASTGRFGLGFSSTYHLTDTPCFVSGDHMVIFDPHCAFAPGATTNQPGLRIRFKGSTLPSSFPHQFLPFRHFGCDFQVEKTTTIPLSSHYALHSHYVLDFPTCTMYLSWPFALRLPRPFQESFNGTLFRFPLRTASLARRSEISKRSYSTDDAKANLVQFVSQLSQHLLFLRSVRCIEIYHCNGSGGSSDPNPILDANAGSGTSLGTGADGASPCPFPGSPILLHRAQAVLSDMSPQNDQTLLTYFDKNVNNSSASTGNAPPNTHHLTSYLTSETPDLIYCLCLTHPNQHTPVTTPIPPPPIPAGPPPRDLFYKKLLSVPDHLLPLLTFRVTVTMERYLGSESKLLLGLSAVSGGRGGERGGGDGRGGDGRSGETGVHGGGSPLDPLSPATVPSLLSQEQVSFFVVSGLRGGQARRMACDEATRHLKLVPFGAVAACVNGDGSAGGGAHKLALAACPPLTGQAFCFLPLPVHTQVTPPLISTPCTSPPFILPPPPFHAFSCNIALMSHPLAPFTYISSNPFISSH